MSTLKVSHARASAVKNFTTKKSLRLYEFIK